MVHGHKGLSDDEERHKELSDGEGEREIERSYVLILSELGQIVTI